ncbi:restriction endonuclease subunit S [Paenibacillus sp. MZ04-78.2]|uniref:restriction endonuclease subunit S n=1 Tax=Paenibacillus sp. MZ04-78.2 TaxID=2962034 RepID=UPI0020B736A7|nr:restriction endonuclease subunit S [Paenibacillus sp. MZ04-78.2]MCP3776547.1 restriction endonuclease subunit S [Paenibacillus sp. MZ04-78.2]
MIKTMMNMISLADVCEINPSKNITGLNDQLEVSFLPMSHVSEQGEVKLTETKRLREVKAGFTYFENGDVLFAKITPCMENGKGAVLTGLKNNIGFGSTEFHVLRPKAGVNSHWLYHITKSKEFRKLAEINMTGSAGQKRVPVSFFHKFKLNVPTLEVQQKIANTLDKVKELIDKRKVQIEVCDELVKCLFYDMFGDPVKNNKNHKIISLEEIGEWKSGGTPSRSNKEFYNGSIPWLSSGELNSIYTKDSLEHINEDAIKNSSAKLIPKESLLLGMYDTAALKSTINLVDCACNQAIAYAKLNDSMVNTVFVYYGIQFGKEFYKSQQRGVRQKNLNLSMVKDIKVLYPPLDLQNRFAEQVKKIEYQKQRLQQSLTELENNFNALMQRAFKGELF